ncbi:SAM-dependent chlorinase/fluorinase [Lipingzhangella sp. LS1_29]|uniref:SAM-dependent chlorinase/fluorinase n=1 Tax=Lipingzhangella rawalii TaxID=2055835 RepID=A0ABU2H4I4_9ACTN|nr:SAM-dependent chlorinase/fluorinase [Lipingzhangella rawalii]MDS1270224.1 SAM-dependent chlorinase/fluorinase [Lipingzhangella rawalii]
MTVHRGYSCLSFLTDYGTWDGFTAACHGQFLHHAPATRVIDITHEVPPGDIRRGAVVLADTVSTLPPAVHVAVVDPGVGTHRRSIAVRAGGHILVGPDNGLLLWAAARLGGAVEARELTAQQYWRHPVSRTFHGRDIYAPVAAQLAVGLPLAEVGPELPVHSLVRLPEPRRSVSPRGEVPTANGEVRTVDRFGNVQLSLLDVDLHHLASVGDTLHLDSDGRADPRVWDTPLPVALPVATTFGDVADGELLILVDSDGHVAIAANGGNAQARLGLHPGEPVTLHQPPSPT